MSPRPYRFSPEDVALLRMIAVNTPRLEIATTLGCSLSTIDRHLVTLRADLGVRTTIEVVVAAVRAGAV